MAEVFEPSTTEPSQAAASDEIAEMPEAMVGRYRLIRKIGEGGLGVVYMAEQVEPVTRSVALKLIKPGMDSKEVIARFEAERQALALMDHPNIAKVFDGGSTSDGHPYFVMEWVQGVRLTSFCDEHRYSLERRLRLFIQVCRGVEHAHQKGIIHRDIKPSNILVALNDGAPIPKIIDFGIAKATEQRLTNKTLHTTVHQFIGTPAYMSPEQADMGRVDVDTRSDIYSLGVLLYEMLVGRTPFHGSDLASVGFDAMRQIVREHEPLRPSVCLRTMTGPDLFSMAHRRHLEPHKLIRAVQGDLDWIVTRCLEKERGRRYETANSLASDIQRHLHHEPVTASPPSRLYRFQKVVRRNKLLVGSAAAITTALLVGTGVSTAMFLRERQAKREQVLLREKAEADEKRAQTQTTKSEHVAGFLKDMLRGVGPRVSLGRDTQLLREILDETARRLKKDLSAEPEVMADLLETLGNVYSDLGEGAHAEVMFREMLALRKKVLGDNHPEVARSLNQLGDFLRTEGKLAEAETAHREALIIQNMVLGERPDVARTYHLLGWALGRQGKAKEAEKVHRRALAIQRSTFGNEHSELADSLHHVGEVLELQGRFAEAETHYRESLAIERKLSRDGQSLPHILRHLGRALEKQGNVVDAESFYREALTVDRCLVGDSHPDVALSLRELGAFLSRRGELSESEKVTRDALLIYKKLFGDHPEVVQTLENLARLFTQKGLIADAEAIWRETLIVQRKIPGKGELKVAQCLNNLGKVLEEQQKFAEAEECFREVLRVTCKFRPNDQYATIRARIKLGRVLEVQGKVAEAETIYRQALKHFLESGDTSNLRALNAISWLMSTCRISGIRDGPGALALAEKAVASEKTADTLSALAAAYAETRDFPKAVALQREAIALLHDKSKSADFADRLKLYQSNTPCREP